MIKNTLILIIILLTPIYSQEKEKLVPKKTIAVMYFETNNCPKAIGRAVTDLLAGKLFNSKYFILLERNQIDLILNEKNFKTKKSLEKDYAADLGDVLKVEKVLVGSISKFENYIVEMRIVDVKKRTVDLSVSKEIENIKEVKEIVTGINRKIDNYYSGYKELSGNFDLLITPTIFYSSGGFTDNARKGYGANLSFIFNKVLHADFPVSFSTGFYNLVPEKDYIESFYMLPVTLNISYLLKISETVRIIPTIGAGYLFSQIKADEFEYRISGDYEYETEYYYNPLICVKAEFNFKIYHAYYLSAAPYYMRFFESDRSNRMMGLDVGLRILF